MRKYQRAILRARAEKLKSKPSTYVREQWTKFQLSFRDSKTVAINKARGTRKKRNWKERISFALAKLREGVTA